MEDRSPSGLVLRPGHKFNGVKVFAATMQPGRDQLGDVVTDWIARHPKNMVVEIVISQSSDAAFHCLSFAIFYWEDLARVRG